MEKNFRNVLFFANNYKANRNKSKGPIGQILNKNGEAIDFSKIENGDMQRRLIGYNLAIYRACNYMKESPTKEGALLYAESTFESARPIFEDLENIIISNAKGGKLIIDPKQLTEINKKCKYKYSEEIIDRTFNQFNFKPFCEGILDKDIEILDNEYDLAHFYEMSKPIVFGIKENMQVKPLTEKIKS